MSSDEEICKVNEPVKIKCKNCRKEQEYENEGNIIEGKWFCCWTCVKEAIKKETIKMSDVTKLSRKRSF